jgi:hypothetical protein
MGRRSTAGHISRRDLEVLSFVARFGVVPRGAVQTWAGTARSVTLDRERRLRERGLLEVRCVVRGEGKLLIWTESGLRVCGRPDLRPAALRLDTVAHECAVAELAAGLERDGESVLSEREMAALERERGERIFSALTSSGRFHRADLLRTFEGCAPEAIEVELTAKKAARLDELLRAWRRAIVERRLSRVVYRCSPHTHGVLERAIGRTKTETAISLLEL